MESKRIKLSIEEQIEKTEESIKQLQNQKRQLKKKQPTLNSFTN